MWFYFVLFFIMVFGGAIYKYKLMNKSMLLFILLWVILFIVAAFPGKDVGNDYVNYVSAITQKWGIKEPSFYFISYICYDVLGSIGLVFVVYAFIAVSLLFLAIKRLSTLFFLSLAIYFCTFFAAHELNQIRAAVGFGFAMLSLKPWGENRMWPTIGFISLAILFHFSFMVLIPICLLVRNNNKHIIYYVLLVPLVYMLYFMGINALSVLMIVPIGYVQTMAEGYSQWKTDLASSINVFSILVMIKLALIFILLLLHKRLANMFENFYLYFKLYILGFIIFIFLAKLPGAAFRVAEIMWMTECLILPMLVYCFKPRWLAIMILLSLCTYWMWLNFVASNFVRPYYFNFNI